MQDKDVLEEQVLEEPVSPPAETPPETPPAEEQPLTKEQVQQMISEASAQAIEQGKEAGRREMQGTKDREVAEANRKAREAQADANAYKTSFGGLDEEARKDAELARYQSRDRESQQLVAEDERRQMYQNTLDTFETNMTQYIADSGLNPKDIDMGKQDDPLLTRQQNILSQVGKKQKELSTAAEADMEKRIEAKLRKDLQLDSEVPPGSSGGSDQAFIDGMEDGSLPVTKENEARLLKLQGI